MRKLLIGVGAAVGLVIGLGFAAPLLVDLNDQKPRITQLIEDATGHRVVLGGDIRFTLLPAPAISVANIRIVGPAGTDVAAASPDLASVDAINLRLSLLPLLGGNVEVADVRLTRPRIVLDEAMLADVTASPDAGSATTGVGAASDGGGSIAVQRVVIEDGSFEWRPASGPGQRIEAIEATLSAPSLAGPFTLNGGASYGGMPVMLDAAVGRIGHDEPVGYDLKLGLAGAAVTLGGIVDLAGKAGPALNGKMRLTVDDAAAFAGLTGIVLPLHGPISAEGMVTATTKRIAVDDLAVGIGESRGRGNLTVDLAEVPAVSLKLRMPRLDGDALVAAARTAGETPAAAVTSPATTTPAAAPGFVLPTGFTADVDLGVDALQWSGAVVQKIALVAAIEGGRLSLSRASAVLPGGTDFGLSGTAATRDGRSRFEGTVDIASDNPRALTDWLKLTPEGLPADRLTRFGLTAKISTDGLGAALQDLVVRLDGATAKGSAGWQPGPRPTAMLALDIDRFDADAYLGAATLTPATTPAPATSSPLAEIGAKQPESPIPDLGFDIGLRLAVGALKFHGATLKAVLFDGTLAPSALRLATLSVDDYAGLALSASGKLGLTKGAPEADFAFRMAAPSPKPALDLAGIDAGPGMERLGRFAVEGRLTGKPEAAAIDAWLAVGETRLALAGPIGPLRAPQFDLKGTFSAPELVALAAQAGLSPPASGPVLGPVDLNVGLRGTAAAPTLRVDGKLGVAALKVDLASTKDGQDLGATLAADNGAAMLTRLGLVGPVSGALSLDLTASRQGETLKLGTLKLVAGQNRLAAKGTLSTGEHLRFEGEVTGSYLDLALFGGGETGAATAPAGGRKATPAASGRWSTKPFDLAALRRAEGVFTVAFDRLAVGDRRFDAVTGRIEAGGGRIAFTGFRTKADSGEITAAVTLDASGEALSLQADVKAQGLDLDALTRRKSAEPGLSGKTDMDLSVTGKGRSVFEVVSSLAGKGAVAASDGRLHGIDLKTLSDGLKTVNQPGDIVGRIASAVKVGSTAYRRLAASLTVARGVISLGDVTSDMDGGTLGGTGTVDLPAWVTRLRFAIKLNEPADLPALGLDITGPIDAPDAEVKSRDIENYYLQKFIGSKIPGLPLPGGSGSGGNDPGKAIVDQIFKGFGTK